MQILNRQLQDMNMDREKLKIPLSLSRRPQHGTIYAQFQDINWYSWSMLRSSRKLLSIHVHILQLCKCERLVIRWNWRRNMRDNCKIWIWKDSSFSCLSLSRPWKRIKKKKSKTWRNGFKICWCTPKAPKRLFHSLLVFISWRLLLFVSWRCDKMKQKLKKKHERRSSIWCSRLLKKKHERQLQNLDPQSNQFKLVDKSASFLLVDSSSGLQ